jgi:hypothetical protein
MITVFGEGRGFRVVWLLEEMGLAYRLRPVDLAERAYVARTSGREAYKRAMETCHSTRAWAAKAVEAERRRSGT